MKNEQTILIVDDSPENLRVLSLMLAEEGYKIRVAVNGKQALESVKTAAADLILLDIQLPQMDGYEVCRRLKADDECGSIPVLFISAMTEAFNKVEAFRVGGDDYITKPFQVEEVLARVRVHLEIRAYRQQLEHSNVLLLEQFKGAFEQSAVGIAHVDHKTLRITKVNKCFSDMLGYAEDELLGKTEMELTPPDFVESDEQDILSLQKGTTSSFAKEKQYVRKDGSMVWGKVTVSLVKPLSNSMDSYHVAIVEDVTERRKLEQHLRQSQKLEAVGHLAGGIAHDFNNILQAITGYADMALEKVSEDGKLKQYLTGILTAGWRAKTLVGQILSFSRQSPETKDPMYVSPIVEEVIQLLTASLPATIKIKGNLVKDTRPVLANATKIHEVVMNLCINAAHAMDEKGVIDIAHREEMLDETLYGTVGESGPGLYSVIEVKDCGTGIEASILENIFEPYFTTKPEAVGSGMGLAVISGIIQSYDGSIVVETQPGVGSTFRVYLPKTALARIIETEEEEPAVEGGTEKILFVDDEEAICLFAKSLLTELGYTASVFTDSHAAWQAFEAAPNDFDLVVTDQTMPGMTGSELAEKMLKIRKTLPIILATGFAQDIDEVKCSELGIRGFYMKPASAKDIARKIRALLDESPAQ